MNEELQDIRKQIADLQRQIKFLEKQVNRNKEHHRRIQKNRDARLLARFHKNREQQIASYIDEQQNNNNELFFSLPIKVQKSIIDALGISETELQKRSIAITQSKREKAKEEAIRIDNNLYCPFEVLKR